jgi:TIR domain
MHTHLQEGRRPHMHNSTPNPHSVFVAHAAQDRPFAELLMRVLGLHQLHAWHDPLDRLLSDGTSALLDKGLRETESLVVVLSPDALLDHTLRQQLRAFRHSGRQGRVLAVLLEPIGEDHALRHELEGVTTIDCVGNKLAGVRELVAAFGKVFLSAELSVLPMLVAPQTHLEQRLLRALNKLSQRNPLIQPKQPLPQALRQHLLMDIIESICDPLERRFRLINPDDGEATNLPSGVLEELVLDSQRHCGGLDTWVPEFFVRAVAARLGEAFRIETLSQERPRDGRPTLAAPPSLQPAQAEALRKFSELAASISRTPATV